MNQAERVLAVPIVGRGFDGHHEDQLAAIAGLVLGDGGSAEDEDDDQRLKRETKSYTHDYFTSKRGPLAEERVVCAIQGSAGVVKRRGSPKRVVLE